MHFAEQHELMMQELEKLDFINQDCEQKIEEREELLGVLKDKESLFETKIQELQQLVTALKQAKEAAEKEATQWEEKAQKV